MSGMQVLCKGCSCGERGQPATHKHLLVRLSPELEAAQRNRHMARGGANNVGARFLTIRCLNHLVNVLHYLKCPNGQERAHVHRDFESTPTCNGYSCAAFKNALKESIQNFVKLHHGCINCAGSKKRWFANRKLAKQHKPKDALLY